MKPASGAVTNVFLVILLVILSLALVACEPSVTIVVQNRTNETLRISYGDAFIGTSVPGGEVRFKILAYDPQGEYEIIAKDTAGGKVVYTANFTRADIGSKRTYRVTIPPTAKGMEHGDNVTGE